MLCLCIMGGRGQMLCPYCNLCIMGGGGRGAEPLVMGGSVHV